MSLPATLSLLADQLHAGKVDLHEFKFAAEVAAVKDALERAGGNTTGAARALGIARTRLEYRIRALRLRDWLDELRQAQPLNASPSDALQ